MTRILSPMTLRSKAFLALILYLVTTAYMLWYYQLIERISSENLAHLRIGVVSSFPPERCGIAEFTWDLLRHYPRSSLSPQLEVIALQSAPVIYDSAWVRYVLQGKVANQTEALQNYLHAAAYINNNLDVITVHFEFGLFGGSHGELVLDFLHAIKVPIHMHLHTIPDATFGAIPRMIFKRVLTYVQHVTVFLPELCDLHVITAARVHCTYIGHGMPAEKLLRKGVHSKLIKMHLPSKKHTIVTPGLLSSSKGIEYMIDAMVEVAKRLPTVEYLVMGQQHPFLKKDYIKELTDRIAAANATAHVRLEPHFHPKEELILTMRDADLIVTPYLDQTQISSSTLSMALGLGCAIVSTDYKYAVAMCSKMLKEPVCLLVPPQNSSALAQQVLKALTDTHLYNSMKKNALKITRSMSWPITVRKHVDAALFARARATGFAGTVSKASAGILRAQQIQDLCSSNSSEKSRVVELLDELTPLNHTVVFAKVLQPDVTYEYNNESGEIWLSNSLIVVSGNLSSGTLYHSACARSTQVACPFGVLHAADFLSFYGMNHSQHFQLSGYGVQAASWELQTLNSSLQLRRTNLLVVENSTEIYGKVTTTFIIDTDSTILQKRVVIEPQLRNSTNITMEYTSSIDGLTSPSPLMNGVEFTRYLIYPLHHALQNKTRSIYMVAASEPAARQPQWMLIGSNTSAAAVRVFRTPLTSIVSIDRTNETFHHVGFRYAFQQPQPGKKYLVEEDLIALHHFELHTPEAIHEYHQLFSNATLYHGMDFSSWSAEDIASLEECKRKYV